MFTINFFPNNICSDKNIFHQEDDIQKNSEQNNCTQRAQIRKCCSIETYICATGNVVILQNQLLPSLSGKDWPGIARVSASRQVDTSEAFRASCSRHSDKWMTCRMGIKGKLDRWVSLPRAKIQQMRCLSPNTNLATQNMLYLKLCWNDIVVANIK